MGLGPGLGAMRRTGTATAAAGARRRSGHSTRNAGECWTRRAHRGRERAHARIPWMFCADRLKCREHRTTGCGLAPGRKDKKRELGER